MNLRCSATGQTDGVTGALTVLLKVPGTFTAGTPSRYIKEAVLWLENRQPGDAITALSVTDIDGVVPVPLRGQFPNYPVLQNLIDSAALSANQKIFFWPNGATAFRGEPRYNALPGQVYVSITVQKATPAVDTFGADVHWEDQS
jgi:hypothetical protein